MLFPLRSVTSKLKTSDKLKIEKSYQWALLVQSSFICYLIWMYGEVYVLFIFSFVIKLITPVIFADVLFTGTADGKILKIEDGDVQTVARIGHGPCGK